MGSCRATRTAFFFPSVYSPTFSLFHFLFFFFLFLFLYHLSSQGPPSPSTLVFLLFARQATAIKKGALCSRTPLSFCTTTLFFCFCFFLPGWFMRAERKGKKKEKEKKAPNCPCVHYVARVMNSYLLLQSTVLCYTHGNRPRCSPGAIAHAYSRAGDREDLEREREKTA